MMEFAKDWVSLALSLIALGTVIVGWFRSGGDKAMKALETHKTAAGERVGKLETDVKGRFEKLEESRTKTADAIVARFQLAESRLLQLESDIKHLPEREQVHRIELAVEKLSGRLETLDERLKPVAAVAMRLQEFELERANGK